VPIDCGAVPANLVESELFGHEKGAFIGALAYRPGLLQLADGGTAFFDESGVAAGSARETPSGPSTAGDTASRKQSLQAMLVPHHCGNQSQSQRRGSERRIQTRSLLSTRCGVVGVASFEGTQRRYPAPI
jgi:hypothetical protein